MSNGNGQILCMSVTECDSGTTKKLPIWSWANKYYNYFQQHCHPVGYVSTNKCAGIVGYSCNVFELNRSVNP